MRLTRQSIDNPAAVAVVAAIVLLLGVLSVFSLPAQLLPQIQKPVISVINSWPGASPAEMESEIIVPVEEVLQGTPGMTEMVSYNMPNFGFMQLEFAIETDMTRALIDIISRLNRLRPLPQNAEKPQVLMGEWGDANDQLIEYYIQTLPGYEANERDNIKYVRDTILPEIRSLYGVAEIQFDDGSGGQGDQLQIIFDPYKAAQYGIDIARVPARIGRSADISSGTVDIGRRQYTVRYEGRYDVDELANLILEWRDGVPIKLGDIARVSIGPGKADGFIYQNGNPAVRLGISKTNDANVLEALAGVKARMDELNATIFADRGMVAEYSFDPGLYIDRSIGLLSSNLIIGMLFSVGALWIFLRQWRATLLIAIAIPVSLLATFIVLKLTGRTLNVISLSGLAFATGMVLDAAIVVLENIVRLRERGETPKDASDIGVAQVWGALLASTVTTVAIFIPIMFLKDAVGQMFADLALTIAIGVSMSLLVAVTILPTTARFWMRQLPEPEKGETVWDRMANKLMTLTDDTGKQLAWVLGLMVGSVLLIITLVPPSNYLPPVQRDTVDSFLSFPPGVSVETADAEIAQLIEERIEPYITGGKEPAIRDYFLWSFPGATGGWLAINAVDANDLEAIQAKVDSEFIAGIPDLYGATFRRSLFGGFESENSVELRIMAADLDAVRGAAQQAVGAIFANLPGAFPRAEPDPTAEATQLQFEPNDVRLAEVGWNRSDLTQVILELGQGTWLGEYFDGTERLDIYLKSERFNTPEQISAVPVQTPLGGVVPLGELVDVSEALGPSMILRYNRLRGASIYVNPPPGMSLEVLISELKTKIEPVILAALPRGAKVEYAGNAAELDSALGTLGLFFAAALVLLVLIMAALFKSLKAAMLVVVSIPLAMVGGVVMLKILGIEALDILGWIGFIILLGLVVNNAILLVAQTRIAEERGMNRTEAVRQALRLRLRPIFMSTLTSLFGMLPLLLFPGAGSGIYRAMAAAIVGGMSVSTLFTLVLLPSLLQLTVSRKKRAAQAAASTPIPAE